jgi:hypothetical protein
MDALVIRRPWIDKILGGCKTWEMRGSRTQKRGRIALIQSGSGTIVGVADLDGVIVPLTQSEFIANAGLSGITRKQAAQPLAYKHLYAWVLARAQRLSRPVPYVHPLGAVIWVTLPDDVERGILRQILKVQER